MTERDNKDRISELPDAVLSHILSYIPTKQSVSTSILSKRWKYVWTFVPVIDIDDSSILEPTDFQDLSYNSFVNNVFNLFRADLIDKFSLKCSKFDKFRINGLVVSATKRKVLELDLCIAFEIRYLKLSFALFAYKELVALKLEFGKREVCVDAPRTLCFPSLKKLYLRNIFMKFDEDSINNLLSACPVLENLDLQRCQANKLKVLNVNAPMLKFLTITIYNYDSKNHSRYKVILDTPNLEFLKYEGDLPQNGFYFKNIRTQMEAYIDVLFYGPEETIHSIPPGVFELVRGISNSKTLHLTYHSMEALSNIDVDDMLIFKNLTKLLLSGSKSCCKLLACFLKNSPILEVLILTEVSEHKFQWSVPIDVPECLSRHLKVVQIWEYEEYYNEEKLGKFETYIRLNAKVLKEFSVHISETFPREF